MSHRHVDCGDWCTGSCHDAPRVLCCDFVRRRCCVYVQEEGSVLESVLSCGAGCTRGWSRVARVRVCRDRRGVTERGPPRVLRRRSGERRRRPWRARSLGGPRLRCGAGAPPCRRNWRCLSWALRWAARVALWLRPPSSRAARVSASRVGRTPTCRLPLAACGACARRRPGALDAGGRAVALGARLGCGLELAHA